MRYCFNINDKQFYFQIKYPILKKHCAVTAKQQVFLQGWRQPFHWHFLGQFLFTCWFLSDSSSNKIYNVFSVIFFVYIFTIYYETIATTLKPEKTCICFFVLQKRLCFKSLPSFFQTVKANRERVGEGGRTVKSNRDGGRGENRMEKYIERTAVKPTVKHASLQSELFPQQCSASVLQTGSQFLDSLTWID